MRCETLVMEVMFPRRPFPTLTRIRRRAKQWRHSESFIHRGNFSFRPRRVTFVTRHYAGDRSTPTEIEFVSLAPGGIHEFAISPDDPRSRRIGPGHDRFGECAVPSGK